MKKLLCFGIIALLITSCSANWHIKRAIQKDSSVFDSDVDIEYRDTIIYRDTTIQYEFMKSIEINAFPEISLENVYIDGSSQLLPSFEAITTEEEGFSLVVWMEKGQLKAIAEIDSTLIFQLQDSILLLNEIRTHTNTVQIKERCSFKDCFIFLASLFIIACLVIVAFIKKT